MIAVGAVNVALSLLGYVSIWFALIGFGCAITYAKIDIIAQNEGGY
jgi:hypothetical protein